MNSFSNKIRMLQRTQILQRTMLQRTVLINKIRILQRTRRNTIGRRSTRVRMTCQAFSVFIGASVIIFVIVRKVKLSVQLSAYLYGV